MPIFCTFHPYNTFLLIFITNVLTRKEKVSTQIDYKYRRKKYTEEKTIIPNKYLRGLNDNDNNNNII